MKPDVHPEYYQVDATCVCGNVITTGSTRKAIKMDICSACHPFFTGTQKIIDTEGRVEKFKKRYIQAEETRKAKKAEESAAAAAPEPKAAPAPVVEEKPTPAAAVEETVAEAPIEEVTPAAEATTEETASEALETEAPATEEA